MFFHVLKMFAGIRCRLKKRSCVIVHFPSLCLFPGFSLPRRGAGMSLEGPGAASPGGVGCCAELGGEQPPCPGPAAEGREGERFTCATGNWQKSSVPLNALVIPKKPFHVG